MKRTTWVVDSGGDQQEFVWEETAASQGESQRVGHTQKAQAEEDRKQLLQQRQVRRKTRMVKEVSSKERKGLRAGQNTTKHIITMRQWYRVLYEVALRGVCK